jgi:2-iminobutanoate/2-iminopropanoate deaminase
MTVTRLNPDTMHKNPAFSQAIVVEGSVKTVYVGGQNGVNAKGEVVGNDIASQSAQAFKNVITVLEAAGASLDDVIKMTIYLVEGQSLQDAYAAVQKVQPMRVPPTVSMMMVAGLANPQYLIEVDAIAVVTGNQK